MPHEKKVKELMIPLTDYPHIPYWFTIRQAISIAQRAASGLEGKSEPTTLLVFDEKYQLMGSLTMEDLIRGIEKKFGSPSKYLPKDWDTPVFLEGLFSESIKVEAQKPVGEIMSPVKETVGPADSIIKAVYLMISQNLRLLPVIDQGTVKGVIRLNEIFNEIATLVTAN